MSEAPCYQPMMHTLDNGDVSQTVADDDITGTKDIAEHSEDKYGPFSTGSITDNTDEPFNNYTETDGGCSDIGSCGTVGNAPTTLKDDSTLTAAVPTCLVAEYKPPVLRLATEALVVEQDGSVPPEFPPTSLPPSTCHVDAGKAPVLDPGAYLPESLPLSTLNQITNGASKKEKDSLHTLPEMTAGIDAEINIVIEGPSAPNHVNLISLPSEQTSDKEPAVPVAAPLPTNQLSLPPVCADAISLSGGQQTDVIVPVAPPPPPLPVNQSANEQAPSGSESVKPCELQEALSLLISSIEGLHDDQSLPEPFMWDNDDMEDSLQKRVSKLQQQFPYPTGSKLYTTECIVCLKSEKLYNRNCCKQPVCFQCLSSYYTLQVTEGVVSIQCPCCSVYVHRDEVFFILQTDMKLKYYRFLVNANKEPHKKTCPQCSVITEIKKELLKDPMVNKNGIKVCCVSCSLNWCFPCEAPWHEGMTCKQFRKGDKLVALWAKAPGGGSWNAQQCPSCKIFIERISGCDHMQCQHCSTEFCYLCGDKFRKLKYVGNHYQKLSIFGCKYKFKPDNPGQRKLIRGSILGLKLLCVPMVTAAALVVGAAVVGFSTVALPFWGGWRIHKFRQKKKRRRRFKQRQAFLEAPCSCSICSSTHVDPYLDQWRRQGGPIVHDLDTVSCASSTWSAGISEDIQVTVQVSPDAPTVDCHQDHDVMGCCVSLETQSTRL